VYILEIVESISLLYPWADILQHLKPLLVLLVALLMLVLEQCVPAALVSVLYTDPSSPCKIMARSCDRTSDAQKTGILGSWIPRNISQIIKSRNIEGDFPHKFKKCT
jgi:hypothetical protein